MSGPRFFPASWRYATRADAEGIGIVFSMGTQGVCAVRLELDDARAMQQALADELTHFHLERQGLHALIGLRPKTTAPADDDDESQHVAVRFAAIAVAVALAICSVGLLLSAITSTGFWP